MEQIVSLTFLDLTLTVEQVIAASEIDERSPNSCTNQASVSVHNWGMFRTDVQPNDTPGLSISTLI